MPSSKKVNLESLGSSLHFVTRPVLFFIRVLGVFPVAGLFSNQKHFRFEIRKLYAIYCSITVIAQTALFGNSLFFALKYGVSLRNLHKMLNRANGLFCCLNIIFMAKKWPHIVKKVVAIEKSLPRSNQRNILPKCKIMAFSLFCCTAVDFALGLNFYTRIADVCYVGDSLSESYYRYTLPAVSDVLPFSYWTLSPALFFSTQASFLVQFGDVIIVVISIYLASHFKELYHLTILYKDKIPSMWHVLRVRHTNLVRLVHLVNDVLSPFIMLSFGTNLALICLQLYKLLRSENAHVITPNCDQKRLAQLLASSHNGAFYISSEFLIVTRTLASALFAAEVHLRAQAPLNVLFDVSSQCYNAETRRFIDQIASNKVALNGYHFFYVTRGTIITMMATVVTYELVLLQYV